MEIQRAGEPAEFPIFPALEDTATIFEALSHPVRREIVLFRSHLGGE